MGRDAGDASVLGRDAGIKTDPLRVCTDVDADRVYCSQMAVVWNVPQNATPGAYRIRFVGSWMNGVTKQPVRYQGMSNTFVVQ